MKPEKTTTKILNLLKDGAFHSGEALGTALDMSRSAIWKGIQQLTASGISIDSVTGKGYRIPGGLELLDEANIRAHLTKAQQEQLHTLILLEKTTSTNDESLHYAKTERLPQNQYVVIAAEQQTAGRGRLGKTWISPFGHNIYCSLLFRLNSDLSALSGLSLIISLAIRDALIAYGVTAEIILKWPNDILIENQKAAGVLMEMTAEPHGYCDMVIGIGINTFLPPNNTAEITQPCTDLKTVTGNTVDRNRLMGLLLGALIDILEDFKTGQKKNQLARWQKHAAYIGQSVVITNAKSKYSGTFKGITEKGGLVITNEKQAYTFNCGEVSLRRCP